MDDHSHVAPGQLRLFDSEPDPWQVVCGRLVGAARAGALPRSLIELARIAGIPPARLRRCEKLAEREGEDQCR
jgi:hypothetical protein